jgi:hypothetical protein
MSDFSAQVFQNPYLPENGEHVNAVLTIQCSAVQSRPAPLTLGAIIDCSGSMGEGRRIQEAKKALAALIELLPEQAHFFIIAGNHEAFVVVPSFPATAENKIMALSRLQNINATGGTAMSQWLQSAASQFRSSWPGIHRAVLLTDGKNDNSDPLEQVLSECAGQFQVDARGVGLDWQPDQLRRIAEKLLGTVDIVADPDHLQDDFLGILKSALGKGVAEVKIRLWTPQGAQVEFLKLVSPEISDITPLARTDPAQPQIREYPTGAWGQETRDYHLCLRVKPGKIGQRMLAGRVTILTNLNSQETKLAEAQVLAEWTDDEARSTLINNQVAHYTGQAQLAQSIQEGIQAQRNGNIELATTKLGLAYKLAQDSGNEETTRLLTKVVDVIDPERGTVRLKRSVDHADAMTLDTRSTRTRRIEK